MRRLATIGFVALLGVSVASNAFGWGAVSGPRGGAAYRGPAGGAAVRTPSGAAAEGVRPPTPAERLYPPPAQYVQPPSCARFTPQVPDGMIVIPGTTFAAHSFAASSPVTPALPASILLRKINATLHPPNTVPFAINLSTAISSNGRLSPPPSSGALLVGGRAPARTARGKWQWSTKKN
jgi:hypothetical protein